MMTDNQMLKVECNESVETVIINRPDAGNALNGELVDDLVDNFEGLRDREEVRLIILRGEGKHFCAGLDLNPHSFGKQERIPHHIWKLQRRIARIYLAMRKCPQPIISLIQGAACGGGFSLALASDIRIAGKSAKMNAAYLKIGLSGCDMGSSYFLPRLVGASVAAQYLMTGRFIEADRALAINLVAEVVEDADLESAAQPYVQEMLRASPMGLRLTKDALNISVDAPSLEAAMALEDRHQALLSLTEDAQEAGLAFFEKRDPSYQNR
jgi:enoyl-CoA hydratase